MLIQMHHRCSQGIVFLGLDVDSRAKAKNPLLTMHKGNVFFGHEASLESNSKNLPIQMHKGKVFDPEAY
jgi:hypothetical protein